jgi:hypothetical protein
MLTAFEYARDAFAVIGIAAVMSSLSLAGIAALGAWLEGERE